MSKEINNSVCICLSHHWYKWIITPCWFITCLYHGKKAYVHCWSNVNAYIYMLIFYLLVLPRKIISPVLIYFSKWLIRRRKLNVNSKQEKGLNLYISRFTNSTFEHGICIYVTGPSQCNGDVKRFTVLFIKSIVNKNKKWMTSFQQVQQFCSKVTVCPI